MLYWIYDYPTGYMGALFALVFLAFTWLGLLAVRPLIRPWVHSEDRANDMVGFALSSFSVLYGLLLGLLAVASYQNFTSVSDNVDKEASSVAALYRDLSGYPQPIRGKLQNDLREYTYEVIEKSWPLQRQGIVPSHGTDRITTFFDDLLTFKPAEKAEEIIHAEALRQFNRFVELRRSRLANVTTGIPAVLWWVVGIGALLNIVLVWMLDMEAHVHLLLSGVLSIFLGIVIFLIAAMDNPFRGDVSVGPNSFQLVYDSLMKPEKSPQQ